MLNTSTPVALGEKEQKSNSWLKNGSLRVVLEIAKPYHCLTVASRRAFSHTERPAIVATETVEPW